MSELDCCWDTPEVLQSLPENEVQVWKICTTDLYSQSEEFEKLLNETEKNRANQFRFEDSKKNFVICRGALRFLLSRYIKENPKSFDFSINPYGKPEVTNSLYNLGLKFNLSHSNEICLIAFSRNQEIGIDIEKIIPHSNLVEMAKKFLTESEFSFFLSITPENQLKNFYSLWSAKEAVLKAIGCGLIIQPDQIEIDQIRENKEILIQYHSSIIEIPCIEIVSLNDLTGYTVWLVIAGKAENIRKFQLTPKLISF